MARPVALITGASAGLGVDYAKKLAARGHDLVLVARRRERLDALAAELARDGVTKVHVCVADLARPGCDAEVFAFTTERALEVSLLVNNAGFGFLGAFHEEPLDEALRMVDLHCRTTVALTHRYLPGMLARRAGGVINVASTASFQPLPYFGLYAATKAFMLSLTEALAEEVRGAGVTALCVCPGPTRTEFNDVARIDGVASWLFEPSELVVERSLRALDRRRTILVSGFWNAVGSVAPRFFPRSWVRGAVALAVRWLGLRSAPPEVTR
jgi:short-subunit dehydrogenase